MFVTDRTCQNSTQSQYQAITCRKLEVMLFLRQHLPSLMAWSTAEVVRHRKLADNENYFLPWQRHSFVCSAPLPHILSCTSWCSEPFVVVVWGTVTLEEIPNYVNYSTFGTVDISEVNVTFPWMTVCYDNINDDGCWSVITLVATKHSADVSALVIVSVSVLL